MYDYSRLDQFREGLVHIAEDDDGRSQMADCIEYHVPNPSENSSMRTCRVVGCELDTF